MTNVECPDAVVLATARRNADPAAALRWITSPTRARVFDAGPMYGPATASAASVPAATSTTVKTAVFRMTDIRRIQLARFVNKLTRRGNS
jgi:hypothetical protein